MKIPLYQAQVSPTNEAPGQQFRTRYNPNLAANTELAKGKPLSTALTEIGEFARVRYELARDNLLNEVTLATDEKMAEAFKEMSESRDFNRVLDGDNPLWTQKMTTLKSELKNTLGKDKYSNAKFDAYFGQSELRSKLKLRGVIDRKVKQAAIQYRNMQKQNFVDTFGVADGDINEAKKGLVMLDVGDKTLANKKVNGQPYVAVLDKMKKQTKAALYAAAEQSLVEYAFKVDNLSSMQVMENVVDAVINNEKTADNSYTTQLLSLIAQSEGKDEALKIIRRVAADSQFVDKITNNLPSDIRKAKVKELESNVQNFNNRIDNLGDYQYTDEADLQELQMVGNNYKEIALALGSKKDANSIDKSLDKINRQIKNKEILNEFNQTMPKDREVFYKKYEDNQETAEGVADFKTAVQLTEKYNKELSDNEDNIIGFSLEKFGDDYQRSTNQVMPSISFDELSKPPTESTIERVKSIKDFAVWTQNNVKRSKTMQVLPKSIIEEFIDVQAQSNRLGDLTAFQNLFDHFQSVDLYDEVLMQLGKSPALLAVGDLIQRNKTKDANLIINGIEKLSTAKELVPSDLKSASIHNLILSEVFDTDSDVGRSSALAYGQAAQAHQIGMFDLSVYDLKNFGNDENARKERINTDAFNSINAVLGASLGPDGNQYGGIQEINNSLMLIPDAFTSDDVEHFISNLNNTDVVNGDESLGRTVDPNTLRDIRNGGDFEFKPISSSQGSDIYIAFKREQDGQRTLVSLFEDKVETDVPALFKFNTVNLGIKYTENPENNLSVVQ